MKLGCVWLVCGVMVLGFGNDVRAQGKGGPKTKPVAAQGKGGGSTHVKTSGPKSTGGAPKAARTTTSVGRGGGHAKASDAGRTPAKTARPTAAAATTTTAPAPASSTTPAAQTAGSSVPLTPVQQKLQRNTNLAAKLQSRLPAGTDLNTAAAGFRNLGQFVAAVNASSNLGLDFTTLKTAMVTDGKSLGQAIQAQNGTSTTAAASDAAVQAQRDADAMIRSGEQQESRRKPSRQGRS